MRGSFPEEVIDRLFHDLSVNDRNGIGQGNVLRTYADAVLSVTALVDASIPGHGFQSLAF